MVHPATPYIYTYLEAFIQACLSSVWKSSSRPTFSWPSSSLFNSSRRLAPVFPDTLEFPPVPSVSIVTIHLMVSFLPLKYSLIGSPTASRKTPAESIVRSALIVETYWCNISFVEAPAVSRRYRSAEMKDSTSLECCPVYSRHCFKSSIAGELKFMLQIDFKK